MKTLNKIITELTGLTINCPPLTPMDKGECKQVAKIYAKQEMINFLEEIREYERESHNLICFDERESSEFVDIYLKHRKIKTTKQTPKP